MIIPICSKTDSSLSLQGALAIRNEELIRKKFDAWWHYLGLFKDQLATNVETVVLPFLQVLNYFDLVAHDRTTFSRGLS